MRGTAALASEYATRHPILVAIESVIKCDKIGLIKSFLCKIFACFNMNNMKKVAKVIIVTPCNFVVHNPGTAAMWIVIVYGAHRAYCYYQGSIIEKFKDLFVVTKKLERSGEDTKNLLIEQSNLLKDYGIAIDECENQIISTEKNLIAKTHNVQEVVTKKIDEVNAETSKKLVEMEKRLQDRMVQIENGQQRNFTNILEKHKLQGIDIEHIKKEMLKSGQKIDDIHDFVLLAGGSQPKLLVLNGLSEEDEEQFCRMVGACIRPLTERILQLEGKK